MAQEGGRESDPTSRANSTDVEPAGRRSSAQICCVLSVCCLVQWLWQGTGACGCCLVRPWKHPANKITAVHSGGTIVAAMYGVPVVTHCHSQLSTAIGPDKVVPVQVMKAYRGSRITAPPILYISMPFHSQFTKCCSRHSD